MNARKSTGPITDAGKKRSSLNAIRNGLTRQVVILPAEEMGGPQWGGIQTTSMLHGGLAQPRPLGP